MKPFDLHMHTVFSDGRDSPEQMVLSAIGKGLGAVGISDHSYTSFDLSYCMKAEEIPAYIAEIYRLKEKYSDRIRVLCGIEQDMYADFPADFFDYRIGSLHYVDVGETKISVDHSMADLALNVEKYFGGSYVSFAVKYFEELSGVAERTAADVVGHFDLVTKFNEGGRLFDENDPRYVAAWKAAADRIMRTCRLFEINTGAMGRGYRKSPYPSAAMRDYIISKGGFFILSSDAHSAANVCFAFGEAGAGTDTVIPDFLR